MAGAQLATFPPLMPVMVMPVVCICIDSTTRSPTAVGCAQIELFPDDSLEKTLVWVAGGPALDSRRRATGAGLAPGVWAIARGAAAKVVAAASTGKVGETSSSPIPTVSSLSTLPVTWSLQPLHRSHDPMIQTRDP